MLVEIEMGNAGSKSFTEDLGEYLNKGIKEIIQERPEIETILDEYNIGCGPCMVGTCLLKDIVEIHALSPNDQQDIMNRISQTLHHGSDARIAKIQKKKPAKSDVKLSLPMQILVDEHKLIKRLIAQIPNIIESLDLDTEEGRQRVLDGVDFIRTYADRYHHAKEEDLLFKYFDEDLEILKVMHKDHQNARNNVKNIVEGVKRRDQVMVREHLYAYHELLVDHIRKEDDILYPWMDRNISKTQVNELFSSFLEVDEGFGDAPASYEIYVRELENSFCTSTHNSDNVEN